MFAEGTFQYKNNRNNWILTLVFSESAAGTLEQMQHNNHGHHHSGLKIIHGFANFSRYSSHIWYNTSTTIVYIRGKNQGSKTMKSSELWQQKKEKGIRFCNNFQKTCPGPAASRHAFCMQEWLCHARNTFFIFCVCVCVCVFLFFLHQFPSHIYIK